MRQGGQQETFVDHITNYGVLSPSTGQTSNHTQTVESETLRVILILQRPNKT